MAQTCDSDLLMCYNRGCGKSFDPKDNKEDSCTFHPGEPYFHDAYKGWTCCKKKCTDFTEFLNVKGCSKSFHNPVKPPEPEKQPVDKSKADEVIEYRAPIRERMERPPFESPQVELKCKVAPAVAQLAETLQQNQTKQLVDALLPITAPVIGTQCKNSACKQAYEGPQTDDTECRHHPGVPIFHEGAKFWSCCKKRTMEFEEFLKQAGCQTGKHCWYKKRGAESSVNCRYDWHQTGTHVVVAVYAKKYDPEQSAVRLSPVRLTIELYFPEEGGSFNLDLELRGVVDVARSTGSMLGTKLEVMLRKAEPGSWAKLSFPRDTPVVHKATPAPDDRGTDETLNENFDAVDLSDL